MEEASIKFHNKGFRVFWTGKHMEARKPLHPHTTLALCISSLWPLSSCKCAKFLRLYPTRCDPMDYSPPYSVHGTLQARILEWVACAPPEDLANPGIKPSFLYVSSGKEYINELNWFSSVQSLSHVQLCDPMDCSTLGLPVHHQLTVFTQTYVH